MNHILLQAVFLAAVLGTNLASAQAATKIPIPRSGDTTLVARSASLDVRVAITTGETKRLPKVTYLRAKSWVELMVITVNGSKIWLPPSVFIDLYDLRKAELRLTDTIGVLTLEGSDASQSYWAQIEFDDRTVKRKLVGGSPDVVTQETKYRPDPDIR